VRTALVDELVGVLEQQTAAARDLLEVLQADQQRIVRHDIPGLEESNRRKEEIALGFQALERSRRELSRRLGVELGLAPDDVRVSALVPRLGGDGERLQASAEKLRAVVGSLQELVAVGRGFLEQSVLGIRSLLALIQSLRSGRPGTYDSSGRIVAPPPIEAVALRREA
jgi:flagellar biosynthesis/type III secretory pathway chaperone